jgi:RNA polymerase sigma-70 factor (ECF subfamily)
VDQAARRAPEGFDELLAAAASGAAEAQARLCGWLGPPVAGYLRARGADDPDDLANEVLRRVLRVVHTFRGDEARFRSWVFTIARNALVDDRRRAARRPAVASLAADETTPPPLPSAEHDALARLAAERVEGLLASLSPDQRDVLLLRVVADLAIDQTAAVLGKSPEAVKALQRRALGSLQRRILREGVSR